MLLKTPSSHTFSFAANVCCSRYRAMLTMRLGEPRCTTSRAWRSDWWVRWRRSATSRHGSSRDQPKTSTSCWRDGRGCCGTTRDGIASRRRTADLCVLARAEGCRVLGLLIMMTPSLPLLLRGGRPTCACACLRVTLRYAPPPLRCCDAAAHAHCRRAPSRAVTPLCRALNVVLCVMYASGGVGPPPWGHVKWGG